MPDEESIYVDSISTALSKGYFTHEIVETLSASGIEESIRAHQASIVALLAKLDALKTTRPRDEELKQELPRLAAKFPWLVHRFSSDVSDYTIKTEGGLVFSTEALRLMFQDFSSAEKLGNQGYFYTGMPGPKYQVDFSLATLKFVRLTRREEEIFTSGEMFSSKDEHLSHPHASTCSRTTGGYSFDRICNGNNRFHPSLGGTPLTSPIGLVNGLNGLGIWLSTCNVSDTYDSKTLQTWMFSDTPKMEKWEHVRDIVDTLVPALNAQLKDPSHRKTHEISVANAAVTKDAEVPRQFSLLCEYIGNENNSPQQLLLLRDALIAWDLAYSLNFEGLEIKGRNMKDQILYDLAAAPTVLDSDDSYSAAHLSVPAEGTVTWEQQLNAPTALVKMYRSVNPNLALNL